MCLQVDGYGNVCLDIHAHILYMYMYTYLCALFAYADKKHVMDLLDMKYSFIYHVCT